MISKQLLFFEKKIDILQSCTDIQDVENLLYENAEVRYRLCLFMSFELKKYIVLYMLCKDNRDTERKLNIVISKIHTPEGLSLNFN